MDIKQQVSNAIATTGPQEHIHASFVANLYFRLAAEENGSSRGTTPNSRSYTNIQNLQQMKSLESLGGYLS
jgi:hypothetical protein